MEDLTYEALFQLNHEYIEKDDYDNAIEDYTRAINIKPDNMTALYCRAIAYYNKYDYDRAIADFEALLPLANSEEMKLEIEYILKMLKKEKEVKKSIVAQTVLQPSPCAMSVEQIPKDFVVEGNVLVKYNGRSRNVVVPDGITVIGDNAFSECNGLKSITISSSVISIGEGAFYFCIGLRNIKIPSSVTSIGICAFYWCRSLNNITIPSSVKTIGEAAFDYCNNLKIIIVSRKTQIGKNAFPGNAKLIYSD